MAGGDIVIMNKYQKRVNRCARWSCEMFDITWRKSKINARKAVKYNEINYPEIKDLITEN